MGMGPPQINLFKFEHRDAISGHVNALHFLLLDSYFTNFLRVMGLRTFP